MQRQRRSARTGVPSRWQGSPSRRHVSTASHVHGSEVIDGDVFVEGDYVHEGDYIDEGYVEGGYLGDSHCDSCGGGGCDGCDIGSSFCDGCAAPHRFCICFPSHGWVHAEYLLWFQSGMRLPPLVTTSPVPTARTDAGVLGLPTTSVLFGDNEVLTDDLSGFRIRFGWWLANFPGIGIEGEYVGLGETTENYFNQSSGNPIIARPFFNARDGAEDAELVAFPDVVSGSISADVTSQLDGAAFRFRRQLCCSSGCGFSELCCQTVPTSSRFDGTLGYRFWELDESLQVREQLQLLGTNDNGRFTILDRFETRNQFNGAELGLLWQGSSRLVVARHASPRRNRQRSPNRNH